jgi:hypothetical protein|tara:strand:- start:780 stop:1040 length:261 start_codon:yes stop_codon:yes gene_type:complete
MNDLLKSEAVEDNNVININGKDYSPTDLNQEQHYMIAQVRDLQHKAGTTKFQLDQIQVSLDYFTNKVIESIEAKDEPEVLEAQLVN